MIANIVGIKRFVFNDDETGVEARSSLLQIVTSFPLFDDISNGLSVCEIPISYENSFLIPVTCQAYFDFNSKGQLLDFDILQDLSDDKNSEQNGSNLE